MTARIGPVVCAALVLGILLASGCFDWPDADLDGPRVVAASLIHPRSVEVPVVPKLVVEFSEAIDPATVHPGSVALIAWEPLESCARTPLCAEGSCERGTCQTLGLTQTQRRALGRGELGEVDGRVAVELVLGEGAAGPDSRLTIVVGRPLAAKRRHTLLLGGLRDRSGAPLVDEHDRVVAWQRDFVTASRGSAGPQPALIGPRPGELEVATNLAFVDTELWPPVPTPSATATLELEAAGEAGEGIVLGEPSPCPGWAPGTCLRWRPNQALAAQTRYRIAGGTLVDRHGRPALRSSPDEEVWFRSASGPDLDPPNAEAHAELRGRCLAVWVAAGEPVAARLSVGEQEGRASVAGSGWIGLALADAPSGPGEASAGEGNQSAIAWTLELDDLAGNRSTLTGELPRGPSLDPELPRIDITEILANPLGPEPHNEFVELEAGPDGAETDGLYLADVSFTEVLEAWSAGKSLGDPLPSASLEPGELAIVVATGFAATPSEDVEPAPGTRKLVVDASIGDKGLANAGEPLSLWLASAGGPVLISSYGNWIDPGPKAHEGRSVVVRGDRCDLADRWISHPLGSASPGFWP
jgi:hypothetical protein